MRTVPAAKYSQLRFSFKLETSYSAERKKEKPLDVFTTSVRHLYGVYTP